MHDTHLHLDLVLGKKHPQKKINLKQKKEFINKLIIKHEWVVQPTVSNQNYQKVVTDFGDIVKVYFLLGSHPEIVNEKFNLKNYLNSQENILIKNPNFFKLLGIGECGLDYFYTQEKAILNLQKALFESQIERAINLNLPLIIHCREAFRDVVSILKNYPPIHGKFLIHCFTGDKEILKEILNLGGKVAFGGILTFGKNAEYLRESLVYCPDDSWVLETDAPFLSPTPKRGEVCLPGYIEFIAQKVSELKKISVKEIWQISRINSLQIFPKLEIKNVS